MAYFYFNLLSATESKRSVTNDTRYTYLAVLLSSVACLLGDVIFSYFSNLKETPEPEEENATKLKKLQNLLISAERTYQRLFNFYNGPYFFYQLAVYEIYEVTIQLASFDRLARTNDVSFVSLASTLIALNGVLTPIAVLTATRNERAGRKLLFLLDATLDGLFALLTMVYIKIEDLLYVECILALGGPTIKTITTLNNMVEYIEYTQRHESQGRRVSLVDHITAQIRQKHPDQCKHI